MIYIITAEINRRTSIDAMDEDNEDWEQIAKLELNQMADNSKSTSVQDLLSFLESNQDNASSKSKARAEKTATKEEEEGSTSSTKRGSRSFVWYDCKETTTEAESEKHCERPY